MEFNLRMRGGRWLAVLDRADTTTYGKISLNTVQLDCGSGRGGNVVMVDNIMGVDGLLSSVVVLNLDSDPSTRRNQYLDSLHVMTPE